MNLRRRRKKFFFNVQGSNVISDEEYKMDVDAVNSISNVVSNESTFFSLLVVKFVQI